MDADLAFGLQALHGELLANARAEVEVREREAESNRERIKREMEDKVARIQENISSDLPSKQRVEALINDELYQVCKDALEYARACEQERMEKFSNFLRDFGTSEGVAADVWRKDLTCTDEECYELFAAYWASSEDPKGKHHAGATPIAALSPLKLIAPPSLKDEKQKVQEAVAQHKDRLASEHADLCQKLDELARECFQTAIKFLAQYGEPLLGSAVWPALMHDVGRMLRPSQVVGRDKAEKLDQDAKKSKRCQELTITHSSAQLAVGSSHETAFANLAKNV